MNMDPYVELTYGILDDGPIDFEDNPAIAELASQIENNDAKKHPPQLRALALNIWTFEAERNPRKVVQILEERAGIKVGEETIRRWAASDGWAERAGVLHQSFGISLAATVEASVSRASVEAIGTLRDVMKHSESDSSRVKAAMYILGVAGYVPQMASSNINLAVNMGRGALAEASDDELYERSMAYKPDDPDVESPPIEATYTESRIAYQQSRGAMSSYGHHDV